MCYLHNQHLLSFFFFKIEFLILSVLTVFSIAANNGLSVFPSISKFNHWYCCWLSTSFYSNLHRNFPFITFPCHLLSCFLSRCPLFVSFLSVILFWGFHLTKHWLLQKIYSLLKKCIYLFCYGCQNIHLFYSVQNYPTGNWDREVSQRGVNWIFEYDLCQFGL